jgi:hypothetical protein
LDLNPVNLRLYTEVARHYEDSGKPEAAYQLLKERAFPWFGMRYIDYEIYQARYLQRLRRLAVKFNDSEMLRELDALTED